MTGWTGRSHTLFQKLLDHMTMHDHTYTVIQKRRFGMIQARNLLCKFARNFKKNIGFHTWWGNNEWRVSIWSNLHLKKGLVNSKQLLPSDIAFIGKLWMATLKAVSPHEDSNSTTYLSQQYHRIIPYLSAISCRLATLGIHEHPHKEKHRTSKNPPASASFS